MVNTMSKTDNNDIVSYNGVFSCCRSSPAHSAPSIDDSTFVYGSSSSVANSVYELSNSISSSNFDNTGSASSFLGANSHNSDAL